MGNRLGGKVAIVTGGGRGIGRGEALLLAEEGAAVVVNDFGGAPDGTGASQSPADEVVEEIKSKGGRAVANYDDVSTMKAGENLVKLALDSFGRLDILVNNAGILRDRMVFNMSEEEWDLVVDIHMKGHFSTIKAAGLVFRQQRSGRIINTGSSSGLGNMGQANYAAAKEGIVGLTRTVARDLGRYGATCNAIRPGAATRLTISPEMEEARRRAEAAGVRRGGGLGAMSPEAIAPLVVYLATDEAGYINGRDFMVSGNRVGLYTIPTVERTIYAPGEMWTVDQLAEVFPSTIGQGLKNEFGPKEAAPATA
ncbi:MAG: SDR family oxidoreductase [Chloroflexi bacterium]|nr:SDR family oxidoreductase [Chloroflexota bacterium]